jgi:hypothetical protein
MATYMVFGIMTDCDPEPQEIKECGTKEEAVRFMRTTELTAHPDIHYWAENSDNGKHYYSWSCIDNPCTCYDDSYADDYGPGH